MSVHRRLEPVPIHLGRVCDREVRRAFWPHTRGKGRGSDRFLEILGSAERDLLTGLDLDCLAGRRVASHAGGAMPDLQDAQAHQAQAVALFAIRPTMSESIASACFFGTL